MNKKPTTKPNLDELCALCEHMLRKHLFGGRACADADSRCACARFVPSGRAHDWTPPPRP